MATEAGGSGKTEIGTGGFGQVSRKTGILFRYALLAATLVGIVALGVLLASVAFDALQPATADPVWYAVYLVTLGLPLTAFGLYVRRRPGARRVGVTSAGLLGGGLLAAATLVILFTVIPTLVWLAFAIGVAVPLALVAVHRYLRPEASATERVLVPAVLFALSLYGVPTVVNGIPWLVQFRLPVIPIPFVTFLLTLALPVAVGVGWFVARREESRRAGVAASALVVLASVSVVFQILLDPTTALFLLLSVGVPVGYYAVTTIANGHEGRVGLLLPALLVGGVALGVLVVELLGIHSPETWLDWQFVTSLPSASNPEEAGIYPALVGSVLLMFLVVLLAFPIGVGTAVYLEEYAPDSRLTRLIQVNISNLAGVPSVVYGLLGLALFISVVNLPSGSLLVGGATLALLILPIVVIAAQEAIRSVPEEMRQASYGMGATRWQTVRNVVLPEAMPGILTGTILALGRAIGETAPLIVLALPAAQFGIPHGLFEKVSAMPLQIYGWAFLPGDAFRHGVAPAGVVALLVVLLSINAIAVVLRNRYQTERQQ